MRLQMTEVELREYFWPYIQVDLETGCWNWIGRLHDTGRGRSPSLYGMVYFKRTQQYVAAHRVAYETFVGEVPEGLQLGHTSVGDKCAFHDHVRPVTDQQNKYEFFNMDDLCSRGHPYKLVGKAKVGTTSGGGGGCRICQRIRVKISKGYEYCLGCGLSPRRCECDELYKDWR